jgi:hypothetical protein
MNETDRLLTEALYADYYKSLLIYTPFDDMKNYDKFLDMMMKAVKRTAPYQDENYNRNYKRNDVNVLIGRRLWKPDDDILNCALNYNKAFLKTNF